MRNTHACLLVLAGLLTGCTTSPAPFTMSCAAVKAAQLTGPGKQIDLGLFSVRAPLDAERWCLGPTGRGRLVLYTHPLMGTYIAQPERSMAHNTIAMVAMALRHGTTQMSDATMLRQFVERWAGAGFGVSGFEDDMQVDLNAAQRFFLRRLEVRRDSHADLLCVRYAYQMEEYDNPNAQGETLVIQDHGRVCQHPTDVARIVLTSVSERYPVGKQLDPGLFERLKQDAGEPFFVSLAF